MSEMKNVKDLANTLKVVFFKDETIIKYDNNYEFSKLHNDSSLYIDMTTVLGSNILKMILESDCIHIQNNVYKIISREFMLAGTALFVNVEDR